MTSRGALWVSIIIPALNEERYLPNLLADLSKQTLNDFEVIVVDGHSEDKTVAKAKKITPKLPSLKIINSEIRHVCTQRNLGASEAKADTLIFMDSDNRIPPQFLSGIKYHLESSKADILTTRLKPDIINPTNTALANVINLFLEIQNKLKPTYLLEAMIIVRRKCYQAIGGFDESINYAEGKSFIQLAVKLGFSSLYFRDPIWTFSFRRIRKFGVMNITAKVIKMELAELIGLDPSHLKFTNTYPMQGGSFYEESKRQELLAKLQLKLKSSKARKKFLTKLEIILDRLKIN